MEYAAKITTAKFYNKTNIIYENAFPHGNIQWHSNMKKTR